MREVVVMAWCDACALEDAKTAAVSTFTVGIVAGESRPALKLLELCERHNKLIVDVQLLLAEVGQAPDVKPAKQPAAVGRGLVACPICDKEMTRNGLVGHIWSQHRQQERPAPPTTCPDCGQAFSGAAGCGNHRVYTHGWDPVADALSGVKGYRA